MAVLTPNLPLEPTAGRQLTSMSDGYIAGGGSASDRQKSREKDCCRRSG